MSSRARTETARRFRDRLIRALRRRWRSLAKAGEPATGFIEFFTRVLEQATANKSIVDMLAEDGVDLDVAKAVHALKRAVGSLLARAQRAGAVREEIRLARGAPRAGWSRHLRQRTLAVVYAGLRPPVG